MQKHLVKLSYSAHKKTVLNHFVSFKLCVTEKRIFVNKLKFPNGFVVNNPKMNYLNQEVGEEGEDLDGIKKEEPNQELLEVEPELALENQDIHMHDFDYEALKSEGEDDIGLDYVFLIFSQFFSDFLS